MIGHSDGRKHIADTSRRGRAFLAPWPIRAKAVASPLTPTTSGYSESSLALRCRDSHCSCSYRIVEDYQKRDRCYRPVRSQASDSKPSDSHQARPQEEVIVEPGLGLEITNHFICRIVVTFPKSNRAKMAQSLSRAGTTLTKTSIPLSHCSLAPEETCRSACRIATWIRPADQKDPFLTRFWPFPHPPPTPYQHLTNTGPPRSNLPEYRCIHSPYDRSGASATHF